MPEGVRGRLRRAGIRAWWGLAALWLIVQAFLFWRLGIRIGGDTGRYVEAAETLLRGEAPAGKAAWYLGYDLFVAVFTGSGLGLSGVVAGQVALSALAAYCLYRLGARLYNARVGVLAALFYIVYPEIQVWNFYILTESLFVSLAIIAGWLLVSAHTLGQQAAAVAALLFAAAIRPHGLALALAAAAYLLHRLWVARRYRLLAMSGLVAAGLAPAVMAFIGAVLRAERVIEHYASGTIIWGYEGLRLSMPGDLSVSGMAATHPILQILWFAIDKPGYFLQLAGLKLWYEYLQVRPYYSTLHNVFLVGTLLPAYALAGWGALRPAALPSARVLLFAVILLQSLAVSLTFADWDGRHLLLILPFIFVFTAAGLTDLWERVVPGGGGRGVGAGRRLGRGEGG